MTTTEPSIRDWVTGFRLELPEIETDPYPYYARLRAADPVHWADQFGGWVLTRYADVVTILRSPNTSSERHTIAQLQTSPEYQAHNDIRAHSMLNADDPRHTRCACWSTKRSRPRPSRRWRRLSALSWTRRSMRHEHGAAWT